MSILNMNGVEKNHQQIHLNFFKNLVKDLMEQLI